jgi:GxxExxY protein
MNDELFEQEGYDLMGAAFEVYNELGSGFLEEVYHECMERELTLRAIHWQSKPTLRIFYKQQPLIKFYTPDFFVCQKIVVELKAARALSSENEAQLINYLKATRNRVGYLINFGSYPRLEWKRFVVDHPHETEHSHPPRLLPD